ncbi:MAG: MBL fold metallo-hydrolase, partial [Thermoplasmatota archaeon]
MRGPQSGGASLTAPVRIELPVPFPIRTSNAWLIPGRAPLLVDCGVGQDQVMEALVGQLQAQGVQGPALRLVVTHGHVDHAGNAARLGRLWGTGLHALAEESPFLETYRRDEEARNDSFLDACLRHGMPADVAAKLRNRSDEVDGLTEDAPMAGRLRDGDTLAAGDAQAHVWAAPGHTVGSLLVATEENELFTGDTLLEHVTSNAMEVLEADRGRYAQYLSTLAGLRRFAGCRALPGHGAPFWITDALVEGHLAKHALRSERMRLQLDEPRTAWEVLGRVFPKLGRGQTFLGICEVVGHLHALEAAGRVRREGVYPVRFVAA